jgi:hypothetical protein
VLGVVAERCSDAVEGEEANEISEALSIENPTLLCDPVVRDAVAELQQPLAIEPVRA